MPEYLSISKQKPAFPEYLNFETLRAIGIEHLQQLSGKLWTDYNLHDPGVTILEVLCYAVTELGYRNNLDIQDLLAKDPANQTQDADNNFFTPDQILTCNPVTELDLRKRLLDIGGVRNAWIKRFEDYRLVRETATSPWIINLQPDQEDSNQNEANSNPVNSNPVVETIQINGLYTVLLDLDPPTYRDACGQVYKSWSTILEDVKTVLHRHRNLCEDIHELIVLGEETIGVQGAIELDASVDANDVLVEIFIRIQDFLAPHIKFYSLQELLDRGKNPAEIFAGRPSAIAAHDQGSPYSHAPSHGFIDTEELDALTLPTQIHTSDLYRIILDIPGVLTVKSLSICSYINGLAQTQEQPWSLDLAPNYRPVLGIEQSRLSMQKGGIPSAIDMAIVKSRYAQQKLTHLKAPWDDAGLDLPIPQGTYHATLHEHYSIHHDFPLTYGISEDGLPATASDARKAQANQLKGYLAFFDQILANYLVQLSHVRELFSWTDTQARTYFTQTLNFPGVEGILNSTNNYSKTSSDLPPSYVEKKFQSFLEGIVEDQTIAEERRNRFLDHMLARFAESFTDYVLLNYQIDGQNQSSQRQNNASSDGRATQNARIIHDKTHFLREYPALSRDRFRAADYAYRDGLHNSPISGFEQRIARLLGIENLRQRSLVPYTVVHQPEHFRICLGWGGEDREADRPLVCRQTYLTLEAAQEALNILLEYAHDPSCYQRLVYRNAHHRSAYHALEVVDDDGASLAVYDASFPTETARDVAILPLVKRVRRVLLNQLLNQLQSSDTSRPLEPITTVLQALKPSLIENLEVSLPASLSLALELLSSMTLALLLTLALESRLFLLENLKATLWLSLNLSLESFLRLTLELIERSIQRELNLEFQLSNQPLSADILRQLQNLQPQVLGALYIQSQQLFEQRAQFMQLSPQSLIELDQGTEQNDVGFTLQLSPDESSLRFVSAQRYHNREAAQAAAVKTLERLQSRAFYQPLSLDLNDAETPVLADGRLTTYGFAIVDQQGTVLADIDSALGWHHETDRENAIAALQNQPRTAINIAIEQIYPGYVGQIVDNEQNALWLQGTQRFTYDLASLRYVNPNDDGDTSLANLPTWHRERDLVESLKAVLSDRPIQVEVIQVDAGRRGSTGAIGYRFCVKPTESSEQPWQFVSSAVYSTESSAQFWGNRALQLLRGIRPSSPGESLRLLQRQLGVLEYTLVLFDFWDSEWGKQAETEAWRHGNTLFSLIALDDSFRLIDPQENLQRPNSIVVEEPQGVGFTWVLSDGTQRSTLAIHPKSYAEKDKRKQSIQELQDIRDEGFYTIEHLLLRPRETLIDSCDPSNAPQCDNRPSTLPIPIMPGRVNGDGNSPTEKFHLVDPYSFWISVILPAWPKRFRDGAFRQFVERTLRLEAPAHVALKIAWVNQQSMQQFEVAYQAWLEQLSLTAHQHQACGYTPALKELIQVLSGLRSEHLVATLADPENASFTRNPVILNQTPLGTIYE